MLLINFLKLKENLVYKDENDEEQINNNSTVIENINYDYNKNNQIIQRSEEKKMEIYNNSFVNNCPVDNTI